ncbi:hypothetical protein Syn7502_03332 [Synechococcus sp. PCC 7502]|uniref:hypothetical protein n=1 Tax=Synechococcus sp. PCC 7502 TaxID=1173263 RepID=UPI0002A000E7|nr:hypothetical protein [Synechococcus sp. PCC 7502]AFY75196.1 hypothetical protein Syn7502_03332 [Synechococcus sp. PCC 7502]
MILDQSLSLRRDQLLDLGFKILHIESDTVIAGRRWFHWDCLFTLINYTVFVRRVTNLSLAMLESDHPQFLAKSQKLYPSFLPRGCQAGDAVLVVYIADQVDTESQFRCEHELNLGFAEFYVPAALDLSSKRLFLIRRIPLWGSLYYGKFRYILGLLLIPNSKTQQEPLSILGIVGMLLVILPIGLVIFLMLAEFQG